MTNYIDEKILKLKEEIKNIVILKELEKKKSEIDIKKDKEINLKFFFEPSHRVDLNVVPLARNTRGEMLYRRTRFRHEETSQL